MAKAKKRILADYEIALTINKKEAETLRLIFENIAGNEMTTRRGDSKNMDEALRIAGVERLTSKECEGTLRFSD